MSDLSNWKLGIVAENSAQLYIIIMWMNAYAFDPAIPQEQRDAMQTLLGCELYRYTSNIPCIIEFGRDNHDLPAEWVLVIDAIEDKVMEEEDKIGGPTNTFDSTYICIQGNTVIDDSPGSLISYPINIRVDPLDTSSWGQPTQPTVPTPVNYGASMWVPLNSINYVPPIPIPDIPDDIKAPDENTEEPCQSPSCHGRMKDKGKKCYWCGL